MNNYYPIAAEQTNVTKIKLTRGCEVLVLYCPDVGAINDITDEQFNAWRAAAWQKEPGYEYYELE